MCTQVKYSDVRIKSRNLCIFREIAGIFCVCQHPPGDNFQLFCLPQLHLASFLITVGLILFLLVDILEANFEMKPYLDVFSQNDLYSAVRLLWKHMEMCLQLR